jgi:hypothetical protein
VTEADAYRILEVDPGARPEVVRAAFTVLREMCLAEDADDAPRRLAELNRAFRLVVVRDDASPK